MSEIKITYDGPYNVVVQCTDCGTERGSSVVTGTLHPSRTTFDHCENCGGYRDHEPVREAERGEYDGHFICDDCDQQFTNTMDVDLHDCPVDSTDDDEDDDEPEVATDGGRDTEAVDKSSHFSNKQIASAIDEQDGSDHPEALTVTETRVLLSQIQESVETMWGEWMDNVERGSVTLVHEHDDVLVFSTGDHALYEQELQPAGEAVDKTDLWVIEAVHTKAARRLTDYDWGYAYPMVVAKPDDFDAGRDCTEAHLTWLMGECGLSGGVALDYYMVEWHGLSQNQWAALAGKDQGTVSQNVRKAKENVLR